MSAPPPGHILEFISSEPRFAIVATSDPDGKPRQAVTWFRLDADGTLLLNSREGRRWPANLKRDGRMSMVVLDGADGDAWIGLTCVLQEVIDDVDRARADIIAQSYRYHGDRANPADIAAYRQQERVMFRMTITSVYEHRGD